MAEPVRMPKLSDEMKEATVSRWLKAVGDAVAKGEPLAEVETDKVIVEVESPRGGVLLEILAQEQTLVKVDQPICVIGEAGERTTPQPAPKAREARTAPAPPAATVPPAASSPAPSAAAGTGTSNVVQLMQRGPAKESERAGTRPPPAPSAAASPLARRVAEQLGIDLAAVRGTGIGGKVVMADLQPLLDARSPALAPAAPAPVAPPGAETPEDWRLAGPLPEVPGAGAGPGQEDIPHSTLRRTIARRMAEAKGAIPHFYMTAEIDVTDALALRERLNARVADAQVSVNDLMLKATAVALEQVPALNATWGPDALRRYEGVHLGFAVSIEEGLVTPVVRDCHLKSLGRIARETRALAGQARGRTLAAEQLQGGTFTVSNLGMYDVVAFSAIINPPQVGILAVARPVERPVAQGGRVVIRSLLQATLSADHRAVDGVTGAEFLRAFKAALEQPERLLL